MLPSTFALEIKTHCIMKKIMIICLIGFFSLTSNLSAQKNNGAISQSQTTRLHISSNNTNRPRTSIISWIDCTYSDECLFLFSENFVYDVNLYIREASTELSLYYRLSDLSQPVFCALKKGVYYILCEFQDNTYEGVLIII